MLQGESCLSVLPAIFLSPRCRFLRVLDCCPPPHRWQVILDCSEENVAFYEKQGFTRKEVQMALYF